MKKNIGNCMVSYNSSADSLSYTTGGQTSDLSYGWYEDYWYPWYEKYHHHYYYPTVSTYIRSEDKFKKAFKITKLLLKKKLLKSRKLKDFIALVEEIAKEL